MSKLKRKLGLRDAVLTIIIESEGVLATVSRARVMGKELRASMNYWRSGMGSRRAVERGWGLRGKRKMHR